MRLQGRAVLSRHRTLQTVEWNTSAERVMQQGMNKTV